MASLAALMAQQTTATGGVQAARIAYENAVAMGASVETIINQFNLLQVRLQEYNEKLKSRAQELDYIGSSAVRMAQNGIGNQFSGFGVAAGGGNMASSLLANAGQLGRALSVPVAAFAAVAGAADSLTRAFLQRANEIGHFSPEVAAARAMRNVRLMMADIQEAQTLGPGMSRLIEAETDVQIQIREILLPIKQFMIETLADWLKGIAQFLESRPWEKGQDWIAKQLADAPKWIKDALGIDSSVSPMDILRNLEAMRKEREAERKRKSAEKDANAIAEKFFKEAAKQRLPDALPSPDPNGGLLNLPPFLGL